MRKKRKQDQAIAQLVKLGLIDKPDGPGEALGAELTAALEALEQLAHDNDLKISLNVAARHEPASAEAAWLDVVNSLSLTEQARALHLSATFGPSRVEAGQRILGRQAVAAELTREAEQWVAVRGGTPDGVEVDYDAATGLYSVIVPAGEEGVSVMEFEYLPDLRNEAVRELLEELVNAE